MTDIIITEYNEADFKELLDMSMDLFQNYPPEEIEKGLRANLKKITHTTFIAKHLSRSIGFITVSIRSDYVEGSKSSPVGYLEAIYVNSGFRERGVAKQLYEQGEFWISQKGCTEIGSDTWDWNLDAQKFHSKLGFKKDDVLVHYIKEIKDK